MDQVYLIIVAVILLVAFGFMWKRIRPGSSRVQIVSSILSDIRINQRLLEVVINGEQVKRFCTTGWQMHHEDLYFLNKSVQKAIAECYKIAEEYNEEAKACDQFEATGYVANIDLVKMLEQLRRSKSGLEDWLMATTGTTDPAGGKTGFFSGLLGR